MVLWTDVHVTETALSRVSRCVSGTNPEVSFIATILHRPQERQANQSIKYWVATLHKANDCIVALAHRLPSSTPEQTHLVTQSAIESKLAMVRPDRQSAALASQQYEYMIRILFSNLNNEHIRSIHASFLQRIRK